MATEELNTVYADMKTFFEFDENDSERLKSLSPVFEPKVSGITDRFYETLANDPITNSFIEGQVDRLKKTHINWMMQLFSGTYDEAYLDQQIRVGVAHVRIGLDPQFVEGVMNHLRREGMEVIYSTYSDRKEASALSGSLLKILDLNLMVINLAYAGERLDCLETITGMRRKLIERLMLKGFQKKSKK